MVENVPTASASSSAQDVRSVVLQDVHKYACMDYVYVLDAGQRLVGVLSMRELSVASPSARVGDICRRTGLASVRPTTDQEHAVYLAFRHHVTAIPVVDAHHRFLGAIPPHTLQRILAHELHEDLLGMVGVRYPEAVQENILTLPLIRSFLHRTPWLLMGVLGGLLSAYVIGSFEATLEANLVLASFIPLIVYMSDAVGTQMEAFLIRDLAVDHELPFRRYLTRQFLVVLLLAVSISVPLFFLAFVFAWDRSIAAVLGISLFLAVLSSVFTGLLIPYSFSRMKIDPADASGPIATILQDILSVAIYFAVASALL
jgi:magnesium transporter